MKIIVVALKRNGRLKGFVYARSINLLREKLVVLRGYDYVKDGNVFVVSK